MFLTAGVYHCWCGLVTYTCTGTVLTDACCTSLQHACVSTVPVQDISYKHCKTLLKTYVSTRPRRFVTFYISTLEIFLLTHFHTDFIKQSTMGCHHKGWHMSLTHGSAEHYTYQAQCPTHIQWGY